MFQTRLPDLGCDWQRAGRHWEQGHAELHGGVPAACRCLLRGVVFTDWGFSTDKVTFAPTAPTLRLKINPG